MISYDLKKKKVSETAKMTLLYELTVCTCDQMPDRNTREGWCVPHHGFCI